MQRMMANWQPMSTEQINYKKRFSSHELNNEGCKCIMCQQINLTQSKQIIIEMYTDRESEMFDAKYSQQAYLHIIDQSAIWEKQNPNRRVRFLLPEICAYERTLPSYWVSKTKENANLKVIKSKSKMNMFEIQNFFLEGYLYHNPCIKNKKKQKSSFSEDNSKSQCIVLAKYKNNMSSMLTFSQLEGLFKSKHQYLREGLMYLQTLVGGQKFREERIIIQLDQMEKYNKKIVLRAKLEAKIIMNEIKVTDVEYFSEKSEIQFEKSLKSIDIKSYLTYLSLKMIFLSSKTDSILMKDSIFKYIILNGNQYLWDVRVKAYSKDLPYQESSMSQALEIKLNKTMSMLDMQPNQNSEDGRQKSKKAQQIQKWLEKSTSEEWGQMKIIRKRLQKLEAQKKSLIESQEQSQLNRINRSFKMRSLRRKQSFLINPQF